VSDYDESLHRHDKKKKMESRKAASEEYSCTHIMPVLVLMSVVGVGMQQYMIQNHILNISDTIRLLLNTCMDTNMQFTINGFRQLFPDKIFS